MTDGNEQAFIPKNIDEALLVLQQDPPVLLKDQDGQVGNQKTKYADLVQANEKILSRLTELGVLWKTKPTTILIAGPNGQQDARFVLAYKLLHVASGTYEEGTYPLADAGTAMKAGSAITYARRYALIAVTNTVAEGMDDDGQGYRGRGGNMAQRSTPVQQRPEPTAQRASAPRPRPERSQPERQPNLPDRPQQSAPAAAPAGEADGEGPRMISQPMTRKLAICQKEAGAEDGNVRKALLEQMIGRPLSSSKELTFAEGRHAIDAFEKANQAGGDADSRFAAAIDIFWRTTGGGPRGREETTAAAPTVREQTRNAVLGDPGGAGADDEPPWDEPVQEALMPEPPTPIARRGEGR